MTLRISSLLPCLVIVLTTAGCSHPRVHASAPTAVTASGRSYMDLEPGSELRILIPLLKSGGFRASDLSVAPGNATLTVSSDDLIGYRDLHYAVSGKKRGVVRLRFLAAEVTKNGETTVEPDPPELPFALPTEAEHIRLVFLVRESEADHNMAIVGSRRLDALDAFTKQFEQNPNACAISEDVFCGWVPAGIAVRPEKGKAAS